MAPDVMKGNMVPFVGFYAQMAWLASPWDCHPIPCWGMNRTVREEFLKRFWNSAVHLRFPLQLIAVVLGSHGGLWAVTVQLSLWVHEKLGHFVLLPQPADLATRGFGAAIFGTLQIAGDLLDTRIGLDPALHAHGACPSLSGSCAISSGRSPTELEEAALVDGLVDLGRVPDHRILPIALPGIVASFILSIGADLERVFLCSPL